MPEISHVGGAGAAAISHVGQATLQDALDASNNLLAYTNPISATPKWQPAGNPFNPDQLAQIASYMGQLESHGLFQGGTPSSQSPIWNSYTEGQSQQTGAGAVASGIFQNTLGSYVQQWHDDPLSAAATTLGFIGLNIVAGALAPATGGLSEVALWGGFALLNAPQLAQTAGSVMDAIHNPTDQNVTQALINAGTSALTIGSPIKAFKGLGAQRMLLESSAREVGRVHMPGDVTDQVLPSVSEQAKQALGPGQQPVANVRDLMDPTKLDQLSIVPQTLNQLDEEIGGRGPGTLSPISADEESVATLRSRMQVHEALQGKVAAAKVDLQRAASGQVGDSALAQVTQQLQDAEREQRQFEVNDLLPAQRDFAARYGYAVTRGAPMPRMAPEEQAQIPLAVRSEAAKHFRPLWSILQALGDGHWDGMGDGQLDTTFASNLAEVMAREQAPGNEGFVRNLLSTKVRDAAKSLNLKDGDLEKVYNLIDSSLGEDSKEWQGLSSEQKLMAGYLHTTFGVISNYAWKHGHIDLQLGRWVPRMIDRGEDSPVYRLRESMAPSGGRPESRSYDVQMQSAMDSMHEELADRVRPSLPTRDAFHAAEEAKQAAYEAAAPLRALVDQKVTWDGKEMTVDQLLRERNREMGTYRSTLSRVEGQLQGAPERLDEMRTQMSVMTNNLTNALEQRQGMRYKKGQGDIRRAYDDSISQQREKIRKLGSEVDSLRKNIETWTSQRELNQARLDALPGVVADKTGIPELRDLVGKSGAELRKALSATPGGGKLVSGFELMDMAFARYVRQMVHSRFRESLGTLGYALPVEEDVKRAYGAGKKTTVADLRQLDMGDRPIVVRGDIPLGGIRADNKAAIEAAGYTQIFPKMGTGITEQPALYFRKDTAERYKQLAEQARSAGEQQSAFIRSVTKKTTALPRALIMYSPLVHGKNIFGQFLISMAKDPTLAGHAMMGVLKDRFFNPERYYSAKMEHWLNGGVPANRFSVAEHLNWLEQEMTGQRNFGWMMKHPIGAIQHLHSQLAEGWFWKTVDDVGTAAYLTSKNKILAKGGISDGMAGALASEYANNITGQINPLYMSKLWRWGRQMVMFAPSWWASFYRMAVMSLPGSTRLSELLSKSDRFAALDPVKFHSLDIRHRKELVRAHRNFFVTGMATAMVAHDLMNMIASGHHVWDNQPGHEWDLELDNVDAPVIDPRLNQGNAEHAHISSIPFFGRQASLLNAIGLGHDYGFLHQVNDQSFQQLDAAHKGGVLVDALAQGFRQQAAGKAAPAVTEAVGGGLGIDPYSFLANGEVVQVPRTEAMMGLLPGGYQAQRLMDQQRRAAEAAAIETDDPAAQQKYLQLAQQSVLQAGATSAVRGGLGLPDPIYSGDEPANGYHFLSEQQTMQYLQQRQEIHQKKQALSDQLMSGQLSPYDWRMDNEMQSQRYLELLADTYGGQQSNSTANDLFTKRRDLFSFMNNPNLTREQSIQMSDAADAQWNQILAAANPQAKAYWWQVHTSQWTDADYLYWFSQQVKNSLMAQIDGDGGNQIRAAQDRLNPLGLPLDAAKEDLIRQQSPYLWTYNQVLREMGKSSLLGAMISAYSNPFANLTILPDQEVQLADMMNRAGLLKSGSQLARQSSVEGLAAAAKGVSQEAAPAGGDVPSTEFGQQLGQGLSAAEAAQILASGRQSSGAALTPQQIAWLQQIARGGRG